MTDVTDQAPTMAAEITAVQDTRQAPARKRFRRSQNHRELSARIERATGMLVTTRFSVPIYEREVTLQTVDAQRVVESVWGRTMRALYNIDVILRFIGDAADNTAIWGVIDKQIASARKSVNDERTRLLAAVEAHGVTKPLAYGRPITQTFKISSPSALDFAEVIATLDEVIELTDRLWFARIIGREDHFEKKRRWQRKIEAVGNTIFGIARRAMDSAKRSGHEAEITPHLQQDGDQPTGADAANTDPSASQTTPPETAPASTAAPIETEVRKSSRRRGAEADTTDHAAAEPSDSAPADPAVGSTVAEAAE